MPNPYAPPDVDAAPPPGPDEPAHPVADPPREKPAIAADDHFVTAWTSSDLLEAEVLTQMLEAEGIATPGVNQLTAASLGVGRSAISHVIRVPSSQLERAKEVIELFLQGTPELGLPDLPDDTPKPRSPVLRAVVFVILAPIVIGLLFTIFSLLANTFRGR
jgi:hypothetical protein